MAARPTAWLLALGGIAAVTFAGYAMRFNPSTAGFALLIIVLLASLRGGLLVGSVASVIATLCYNYFFLPPLHTFAIREPSNWIALAAFLVTSVTVSRLVIAARLSAQRLVELAEENAHMEALRESEMLKTSLLRAISHDLTTPLTAITIHTEALRRKADAELKDAVAGIADETVRLRRRIDNLLSMARLEAGKAKPRREPTPPADLFRAARENLPLVFQSRPMTVRVEDDCPDADVDPSLMLEVLVNLIENADRVSPAGAPLELLAQRLDPDRVRLEVLDRGPGLPAAADTDVGQRGLGLEIARGLAAANGGSIGLLPRDGGGTRARVDLPAALLEPA
jgi:two-component system sensor histidine kinase KdpD